MENNKDISPNEVETEVLADKIVKIAKRQLQESIKFKEPILARKKDQINLYHGKFPKKLRSMFNVPLPIMSGMVDTMAASWDEPLSLKFEEQHPADYMVSKKVQALWDIEKTSTDVNAKWDYKVRVDRKNAIFYGAGIPKYYAESDPKYKSVFSIVSFEDFHFQPTGGGQIENHIFAGQEGIQKTKEQLESGSYDAKQVAKLIERSQGQEYIQIVESAENDKLSKFRALGLDPESHNYVGQPIFQLVEWVTTYKGERWYLVFDPITGLWLRCTKLKEIIPSGRYPWRPWHTHEDLKNFASKSFTDDMYPVCDAITTLFNQELTNREKSNFKPRAYDEEMFPDVAKLDSASYRPDALVPFDSKGGTRRISDGLYEFNAGSIAGTIDLIGWTEQNAGRNIGITELAQGNVSQASKKASVVFSEQQNSSKRFSYQSQSFTEAYGEIGSLYVEMLKENMPEKIAIKMLGENGYEWDYLKRADMNTEEDLSIRVVSSTADQQTSKLKQDKQIAALTNLIQSPNINSKARDEEMLRAAGYEDDKITKLMDTQNYGNKEMSAKASQAIEDMIAGKKARINYSADVSFMQKIVDFATDHRESLGVENYTKMMDYAMSHAEFVQQNMARKANMIKSGQIAPGQSGQTDTAKGAAPVVPTAPGGVPAPVATPPAPGQAQVPNM